MKKIILISSLILLPLIARAQNWRGNCPNGFMNQSFPWISGGFLMILLLFVLAGLALYVILRNGKKTDADGKAVSILKERYARGEISKKEFDEIKAEITG